MQQEFAFAFPYQIIQISIEGVSILLQYTDSVVVNRTGEMYDTEEFGSSWFRRDKVSVFLMVLHEFV